MMRRDLESTTAARAVDEVVHAIEVISQLRVQRAIAFVGAGGDAVFLRPPKPLDLIVRPVPALRTRKRHRLHLGFFGETIALVHTFIVNQDPPGGRRQ